MPVSAQVKVAYINFLNHCYVDTEVEMKEIYTSTHMWKLFENFLVDICRVRRCVRTRPSVRPSVRLWVGTLWRHGGTSQNFSPLFHGTGEPAGLSVFLRLVSALYS